ncbi:MAG: DUF1588 domain-containing protein [Planctomycetota bacterium]|nr:DUF1588 domain-containing protein [Planctomycetota bacterium]MDA0918299.1 DUF1588 domain-containing protein [Planctomycetota bacterium]MDA1158884.1 DUF1588 domain-containing protein [Planctomycetota bacterium]
MNRVTQRFLLPMIVCALSPSAWCLADDASSRLEIPEQVQGVLKSRCLECHEGDDAEGDVRFDQLAQLQLDSRLELLNSAQDQLFFGTMPPTDAPQLTNEDRLVLAQWLRSELCAHNASQLDKKLRYPDYGNYVEHDTLFNGRIQEKPFTPARRWLVSPQIFHERVNDVFLLTDSARQNTFYGVTNPFVLPDHSGVRDYDIAALDGGHLLVMLNNAEWISSKQIFAAVHFGRDRRTLEFSNPQDRWYPPTSPPAFVAIVNKSTGPTEQELVAAVHTQFNCVLKRDANDSELDRYLSLLKSTIELGGNTEGLRQMLVSVLLESEFLYRQEFGAGQPDEFGRRLLSPEEAAQAIAYALGDQGPDEELQQAASDGRLVTKDDYQREVQRLLADEGRFRGPVDPGLSGKNMQSHVSTHPKLVRFFREFFGYTGALKVFKDLPRSDGYYQNPSRGTAGTPGFLVKEADRVVDWYLQRDEDVFANLLTTRDFFVYHDKDNKTGQKIIAEWKEAYARLKDTDWKTDPERVIAENLDFIQSKKSLRIIGGHQTREFLRHMYFFGETIGKGRTPFTTVSFAHGYTYNHSPFYNLPPTPNPSRYSGVEQKNFKGLDDEEFWDYPVEQPFRIENRKGLLTHPAWLIAHSGNFHTDPIRRGRWIREKLLAGRVPDVPITVDAQVPDDPHKTFRERVEAVTGKAECWKCHQHMNPLGLPFEVFDDFGRYRLDEPLESPENLIARTTKKNGADTYRTKPVSTLGELLGTGDSKLDGRVTDPFDLIDRLAQSDRVRQSIIRHAFRFFMGRNEMLSDSQTLIDADKAYTDSSGSFKAVVVSLLTSDSFMYRKDVN